MTRHRTTRGLAWLLILLALLAVLLWSIGGLPRLQALKAMWHLSRMPAPTALPVPVEGVQAARIANTWGGPRSGGRKHQGVDIFAKRGTPVRSSTEGVVLRIADYGLGGRHVWIQGPANERHYYAHLEDWAPQLKMWDVVQPGTLLGFVGDSGNARGTPPHLHYGIYNSGGAHNPWPLLQSGARHDTALPPPAVSSARRKAARRGPDR